MKQRYTHISFVLDRSGSMESVKDDTIGGFNQFLSEQKTVVGKATITLVQFDDLYEYIIDMTDIVVAKPLDEKTFVPRGWTALFDAIGRCIDETGAALSKLPESDRPEQVIFVILTDGMENASRKYTRESIEARISHQRDVYKWQFVFLGANQDAISSATSIGISAKSSMTYAQTSVGTKDAYRALSAKMKVAREATEELFSVSLAFDEKDRQVQENELKRNKGN
jgi:hypothetical protein